MFSRNPHTHSVGKALSQRAGGHLDSRRFAVFRVAGGHTAPLTEILEFLQREIVPGQVQQSVQQHGSVACGKEETVPVRPVRSFWIESQMSGPERVGHCGRAHRQTRVS